MLTWDELRALAKDAGFKSISGAYSAPRFAKLASLIQENAIKKCANASSDSMKKLNSKVII